MKEIEAIVELTKRVEPGDALALATVVNVRGSAYRHPGARMLMSASGRHAGTISAGCLEADVRERAQKVMASGESRVLTYDSTAPEDIVFGLGLGCNGIVQILIEPVSACDENGVLAFLSACHERRQIGRIATVFDCDGAAEFPPGVRLMRWPDATVTTTFQNAALKAALTKVLADTAGRRAAIRHIAFGENAGIRVFAECIMPPVSLTIFGAGDDAAPLVHVAKFLGWHVTVADARPAYAQAERFPEADAVHCVRPEALADHPRFMLSPDSLVMLMTHHYSHDKELLRAILPARHRYIGILGPKIRTQRLLDELAAEGATFTEECLSRLHGPAGLDIRSETPEEIALSIVAEMQAVLCERAGGPLRNRTAGLHDELLSAEVPA